MGWAQFGGSGYVSRQMTYSGYKVADQESPSAAPLKPIVNTCHLVARDVNDGSVFHNHVGIEDPAQDVAEGDPTRTAQEGGNERWREPQCVLEDQIPGKGQKPFIGHGKPHDAEDKQGEDPDVSVLCDPMKCGFSHCVAILGTMSNHKDTKAQRMAAIKDSLMRPFFVPLCLCGCSSHGVDNVPPAIFDAAATGAESGKK